MILSRINQTITNGIRTIKLLCRGGDWDVRTANEVSPFGIDSNPLKGMKAIYGNTENIDQGIILGYINEKQLAQPGETRLFSLDADGNLSTFIWLHSDGVMDLGGSANHATQWEGLNAAFATYFTNLNTAIAAGVASAGGAYTPPSSLDITAAKLTNIKTQ